jgi:DNA replication protein DnaC
MSNSCPICGGSGLKLTVSPKGERYAEDCVCQLRLRTDRLLRNAAIPERYEHCILESFDPNFHGADSSLSAAYMMARSFVAEYPVATEGRGLLLVGTVGVGKTHLAIGILQALIAEKSVRGLFCDYRELLKRIQESYNPQVATTELQILAPIFDAEVLLLDELGAQKPTDWVRVTTTSGPRSLRPIIPTIRKAGASAPVAPSTHGERCRKRVWETASASA